MDDERLSKARDAADRLAGASREIQRLQRGIQKAELDITQYREQIDIWQAGFDHAFADMQALFN